MLSDIFIFLCNENVANPTCRVQDLSSTNSLLQTFATEVKFPRLYQTSHRAKPATSNLESAAILSSACSRLQNIKRCIGMSSHAQLSIQSTSPGPDQLMDTDGGKIHVLPPEIIQRIFIHLDGKGLATLCRTSQFFQLIAKRELYGRELHISCCVDPITWTPRSGKFGEVKALCRALYQWSSSGPSRRLGYVQSLTLGDIR